MSDNIKSMSLELIKPVIEEIYEDGAKPLVKEVGKALETFGKVSNLLISPLRLAAVTGNTFMERVTTDIVKKIHQRNIPDSSLVDLPCNIAVPTLQALYYNIEIEELRRILINLLATSMDKSNCKKARSAFVVTTAQLEPLDVRIFHELFLNKDTYQYSAIGIDNKHFLNFFNLSMLTLDNIEEIEDSIENLDRLGLISVNQNLWLQEEVSETTKSSLTYKLLYENSKLSNKVFSANPLIWHTTKYGHLFADVCLDCR